MITHHAIARYLERVEGYRQHEAEAAAGEHRARVTAEILTPAVKAAVMSGAEMCVVLGWGRVFIKDRAVVSIFPHRGSDHGRGMRRPGSHLRGVRSRRPDHQEWSEAEV